MGERPPERPPGEGGESPPDSEWLPAGAGSSTDAPPAPEKPPEPEARPEPDTPSEPSPRPDDLLARLRRLRSMLPVSPLPWHWHRRINRGAVIAIAAIVAGGAIASVVIQRASDSESEAPAPIEASPKVKGALAKLSLRQKADAVTVAGLDDAGAAEAELKEGALGGVIIGPEDWEKGGPGLVAQVRAAGSGAGRTPPLIVGRQEGGIYRSYPDLPPELRQIEVAATGDPAEARASAQEAGAAMKEAGFDLNLGPVVDVATLDSPIADRAFSDDPEVASAMAAAAVQGCKASGLACAASHFPGLGGASADTANDPATVSLDAASLEARDLSAFEAAFKAGVPAAVLSLAFYAAYDPVTPAALSPSIATELLREEMGFKGVAITDDLTSGAIAAGVGAPEAAVQALTAGSDLVLVDDPAQAAQARNAILVAAQSGGLPGSRLDEAVARVLALKEKLGLLESK